MALNSKIDRGIFVYLVLIIFIYFGILVYTYLFNVFGSEFVQYFNK